MQALRVAFAEQTVKVGSRQFDSVKNKTTCSCSDTLLILLDFSDCGMNCHKLCKDQVAFECKKNTKVTNAIDSPTLSSTPVTTGTSEGGFDDE